jgi:hypothetical protein
MFVCARFRWLNLEARGSPELQQEQAMRKKPFTVLQPSRPDLPKLLFVIRACH